MYIMQRTQVYFDPETLRVLKEEAREKKTTLASVIRGKIERTLPNKRKKKNIKKMNAAEFLEDIAQLGKKLGVKGPKDLSKRIDEFVYRT